MKHKKVRYLIYLRDVLTLAVTAFGGPQAHMAMFFEILVHQRNYLKEEELIELNALCQILPGPTSTQTITAIGFKIGGPKLAYLTLLIWCLPAVSIMITIALIFDYLHQSGISLGFTKFILPMAISFIAFAGLKISRKVVKTRKSLIIMLLSMILSYFYHSPYVYPAILLIAGFITSFDYKKHEVEEKIVFNIQWGNFALWISVLIFAALLGYATKSRTVLIFENFYRNGSLIFGGGQALIPLLYTEFVKMKSYLSPEEFLSGFSVMQALPGPVFSFSAFIGTLSLREHGVLNQVIGGLIASAGVFLPGTFLIFFVIRFWDALKKYRRIKCSLTGINAAASGIICSAGFIMLETLDKSPLNIFVLISTFLLLNFTKIPAPVFIIAGLAFGFIL
ncbi:chromate efflux transporter [Aureibacter tunicatorum]|uniref:Chromate transporter n=1 Tax=Aureibacter tunicatorum TaxID=866807 RepID=A0AAE4BQY1_9BACT|nr:chromate efflux transporter [Aureibacter tunicatorum]MDR6238076.1 chromate transporter [Aureibacter tunicatorum]BDD03109.1 chromate transporter [Aureibacter tunicatorum]